MAEKWPSDLALQGLPGQTLFIENDEDKLKNINVRDEKDLWLELCLTELSFPCAGDIMLLGISWCHSNTPQGLFPSFP